MTDHIAKGKRGDKNRGTTPREPYLGLRLMLDARSIALVGAEMKLPRPGRDRAHEALTIEKLDPDLLDGLRRLVALLDNETLLNHIAPLIQQQIRGRVAQCGRSEG